MRSKRTRKDFYLPGNRRYIHRWRELVGVVLSAPEFDHVSEKAAESYACFRASQGLSHRWWYTESLCRLAIRTNDGPSLYRWALSEFGNMPAYLLNNHTDHGDPFSVQMRRFAKSYGVTCLVCRSVREAGVHNMQPTAFRFPWYIRGVVGESPWSDFWLESNYCWEDEPRLPVCNPCLEVVERIGCRTPEHPFGTSRERLWLGLVKHATRHHGSFFRKTA
jgi:hypothetical protein